MVIEGIWVLHEIHRYGINNTLENNEQCLQMQMVPAAQIPQQEKKTPFK